MPKQRKYKGFQPIWRRAIRAICISVGVIILLFIGFDLTLFLIGNDMFTIRDIQIVNLELVPKLTVLQSLDIDTTSTIWNISTRQLTRQLQQNPWLDEVSVSCEFPNRLIIKVQERTPVAWYRHPYNGTLLVVDHEARLLDPFLLNPLPDIEIPAEVTQSCTSTLTYIAKILPATEGAQLLATIKRLEELPLIILPERAGVVVSDQLAVRGAEEMARLLSTSNKGLGGVESPTIISARYDDKFGWQVIMEEEGPIIRLGFELLDQRLQALQTAEAIIPEMLTPVEYIDLRFEKQGIVMKPVQFDRVEWVKQCREARSRFTEVYGSSVKHDTSCG